MSLFMNKAIFITVRTGSTRLPNKCLLEIAGRTTIEHLIQRIKRSKLKNMIILCTTIMPADDILCSIAEKNDIYFYRGPVEDKLMRWLGAAEKYKVDAFVTADGDDLFCDPELIDLAFQQIEMNKSDFVEGENVPCGAFTYAISVPALKKVCEIKNTEDTEMMWTYFKDTGIFKCEKLQGVPEFYQRPEIRMTLDYPEDLEFFTKVISCLRPVNENFGLKEIISYLDKNPKVVQINQALQKIFLENQRKKTKLVLKEGKNDEKIEKSK
jgi:spore coat polysaccharide biosynthesis protein SpsF